jgi:VanZ family protein
VTSPSGSEQNPVASHPRRDGSFVRDVLPALVWTATIFVLGGLPNPGPPVELAFPTDKLEHAAAFALLSILALRALRYELPSVWPRAMPWLAALTSTTLGGALELYQLTVPTRSAELLDLIADAVGAVLATVVPMAFRGGRYAPDRSA